MLNTLTQAFNHHAQKLANRTLYLACSGGRDSLSLAYGCYLLHQAGKIEQLPILLHVHHGWQEANNDWARDVAAWADQFGFDCRILPIKLPKNSETHAREARYAALISVMNEGDVLMLGHHQHDQAETMLMRLANGSGVSGLAAMREWQQMGDKRIQLWRPLLGVSRDEISRFADEYHLPYVDDPTNVDDEHARGKLRNHILPRLCQLNPKAVQNIARTGLLLAQASDIIDELIDEKLADATDRLAQSGYYEMLDINKLLALSSAVQSTLIHRWLGLSEPMPPPKRLVDDVLCLAHRTDGDHQTQLLWQSRLNYVICRYQSKLYRYQEVAWACLMVQNYPNVIYHDDKIILKSHERLSIVWQMPHQIKNISAERVLRQTKVNINHKRLHGKKLVQKLGIPTWLRSNLWIIKSDDRPALLITLGRAWRLDGADADIENIGAHFA